MKHLMRLLREPIFHFLAIGALIFVVFLVVDDRRQAPTDLIVITPERIEQLAAGYESVWKRPPAGAELEALIEEDIREEVYYREALALGLDRNDAMVRRRMRQKMEFLLDSGAGLLKPTSGELEAYFAANEQAYRRLPRLAFEQIYLGETPDRETIRRSLSALQAKPPTDPSVLGRRSVLPAGLGLSPPSAIDSVFGKGFFARLAALPSSGWNGPVASAYGTHLVRILDNLPARTPPLEEVRDAVLRDWRIAKAQEIRDQTYAELRKRFVIEVHRGDGPTAAAR